MARTGVDPAMMAWSTLPRVEHLSNDGYCMNHHHHHSLARSARKGTSDGHTNNSQEPERSTSQSSNDDDDDSYVFRHYWTLHFFHRGGSVCILTGGWNLALRYSHGPLISPPITHQNVESYVVSADGRENDPDNQGGNQFLFDDCRNYDF